MANPTINWGTKVISVPQSFLTLVQSVPIEIYDMDLNFFHLALKDLEDDPAGMSFLDTHKHNTEVTLGGLTYARVIEMINSYTVVFEDGQYAVNLLGANSNVGDVVNVNQVSVRSNNSAGLITTTAIEYGEYGGKVTVDPTSSNTGTVYPTGTPRLPVNNVNDAVFISQSRGFDELHFIEDYIFKLGDDVHNFTLSTPSAVKVRLTFESDAIVDDVIILDANISGVLDGGSLIRKCLINDLSYINGFFDECALNPGTITLGGDSQATFINCYSNAADDDIPTIDMNGFGNRLIMRGYNGSVRLTNKTGADPISIDLTSGQIVLDSTFGGTGNLRFAGSGRIIDEGTAIYDDSGLVSGTVTIPSQGFINVDLSSPYSGTTYPTGTIPYPVNNFKDTFALAQKHNVWIFRGVGNLVLNEAITVDQVDLIGISPAISKLDLGPDTEFNNMAMRELLISGTANGKIDATMCEVEDLHNINGIFRTCDFRNTQPFSFGPNHQAVLYNCAFIGNETEPCIFSMSAPNCTLAVTNGQGAIKITNMEAGDSIYISITGGSIELDSTVTGGTVRLYGTGSLINNATNIDLFINKIINSEHMEEIYQEVRHLEKTVFIDTELPVLGDGSQKEPFNDLSVAIDFAEQENIKSLTLYSDITIDRLLKNFLIKGVGTPTVDCNDQNLDGSEFSHVTLVGDYTGRIVIQESNMIGSTLNGYFENCAISDNYVIPDGGRALIKDCTSLDPTVVIDIGTNIGVGELIMSGQKGGITITNMNHVGDVAKMVVNGGIIEFDSSCTDGTVIVGGLAHVINNSSVSDYTNLVVDPVEIQDIHAADMNKRTRLNNVITIFEKDEITPRSIFDTNNDTSVIQPR